MKDKDYLQDNPEIDEIKESGKKHFRYLVLHNDEYHTFDYVIESLIDVCNHDVVQAEQCTFLVHFKGKCDVKKGSRDFLKPMKDALVDRGLKATIN